MNDNERKESIPQKHIFGEATETKLGNGAERKFLKGMEMETIPNTLLIL